MGHNKKLSLGKRETYAWKRFSSALLFGEKPLVISLLVLSEQLCKSFVAPASGSPLLCPTQLSLRDMPEWCFQRCGLQASAALHTAQVWLGFCPLDALPAGS